MKNFLISATLLTCNLVFAQNVSVNSSGAVADPSAMLDINDANKGILVPRIALSATNVATPVTSPATSLLVYNTFTSAVGVNQVSPGYYYWDGAKWVKVGTDLGDWKLLGNAGTAAATNFLGTTDAIDLVFRTNNTEKARLTSTGLFGVGVVPTTSLMEVSSGTNDAIWGHSTSVGGYLGRETNIVIGTPAQTILGAGVYAGNPAAGYTSSFAQSTGLATVAANVNYSTVWLATYNLVDNTSSTTNPSASYSQLNNTSTTLGSFQIALRGYSSRGATTGNPGYTVGTQGTADAQNQDSYGVYGQAFSNSLTRAGGYFEAMNYAGTVQAYAYVGTTFGGVARKITGTSSVSEIIPTEKHGRITMTAPESPEYWYQDYGTVTLVNGRAHVELDEILTDIIVVTEEYPIRAFFTPVDLVEYNGVAMVNKTATGFDLVEINGGSHNGKLDYQLIVKPKTGFGEGRYPQAPGPAGVKPDKEPQAAKAKNQVDGTKVFHWPADHIVYKYDPADVMPIGTFITSGEHAGKFKVSEGVFMENMPLKNGKN
jgi:hypothetical protein